VKLLLVLLLAGCAASGPEQRGPSEESLVGVTMTRDEVVRFGTHRYKAQPATVFKASVNALRSLGYDVTSASPEQGLIMTGRKLVRIQPNIWWGGATTHTRQFVVRLFTDPATNDVVVTALPKVFENDNDISERPVWDLRGERVLWAQLFQQIELFAR
jgi:hypothetical protein